MRLQREKAAGASRPCEEWGKNAALYLPGSTQGTGAECVQNHGSGWLGPRSTESRAAPADSVDVTPVRVHADSSKLTQRGVCREENKALVTCGSWQPGEVGLGVCQRERWRG